MLIPTEEEFQTRRKRLKLLMVTLVLLMWSLGRLTLLSRESDNDPLDLLIAGSISVGIVAIAFLLARKWATPPSRKKLRA
jgi:hypothetical protein